MRALRKRTGRCACLPVKAEAGGGLVLATSFFVRDPPTVESSQNRGSGEQGVWCRSLGVQHPSLPEGKGESTGTYCGGRLRWQLGTHNINTTAEAGQ
jgi:hypothetical protein